MKGKMYVNKHLGWALIEYSYNGIRYQYWGKLIGYYPNKKKIEQYNYTITKYTITKN